MKKKHKEESGGHWKTLSEKETADHIKLLTDAARKVQKEEDEEIEKMGGVEIWAQSIIQRRQDLRDPSKMDYKTFCHFRDEDEEVRKTLIRHYNERHKVKND